MLPAEYTRNLPLEYITLPEALKEAGYKTFFAGKWHLGDKGSWPEDHGFDINIGGWSSGGPSGGYFAPYKNPKLPNGPDGEDLQMRLANETVKFLKENKDKPFLAYLSFYAVHSPIQTTEARWEKYRDKAEKMGISEQGFAMDQRLPYRLHQDNPVYAGLVESMDDAVGVVLKELKELGLDKNTIVIFTSDNGGVTSGDDFTTNNAPLRGGKGYQWEGGIREPYFMVVPWMDLAGKKCDVPVSGTDFYPTILDLAGLPLKPDQHNDGLSLLPLLKGGQIADRALIWHFPHYGNQGGDPSSIIRLGDWKLIYYHEDSHEELYNLKTDLSETRNVLSQNPEIAKRLHNELFDYLNNVGAIFPQIDPEYRETAEKENLYKIEHEKMPSLEKQRKVMLSKEFDPKNNWWGSMGTKD
jgi:arylsulfatase A-like enzyme